MDTRWNYLQDPEVPDSPGLVETVRGRFRHVGEVLRDACRFRRPARPPDWEFDQTKDKDPDNKDKEKKEEKKEDALDKRWDRWLIIDTSLQSHYRVSHIS